MQFGQQMELQHYRKWLWPYDLPMLQHDIAVSFMHGMALVVVSSLTS